MLPVAISSVPEPLAYNGIQNPSLDVVVPAKHRRRLQNAKLPRPTRLSIKQPRWRLHNCKLPRVAKPVIASAAFNRTTTWDKPPLEGDPLLELLLKQSQERQWHAESTQVSDCGEDDKHSAISRDSEVLDKYGDHRERA
jgi:hypothetical protein